MTCYRVPELNGWICCRGERPSRVPCVACGQPRTKLCDGRVPGRGGRTRRCDAPICDDHARAVGPDLDHCPACAARAAAAPPAPAHPAQCSLFEET